MRYAEMRGPRCRWVVRPGHWGVRARVERFVEPSLLLLLRVRPMHGYELLDRVSELVPGERGVDLGNLYRILRGLEEEGIVGSEWRVDVPGPAKRVYRLTGPGRGLLDRWAEALKDVRGVIDAFLDRYEQGEGG